LGKAKIRKWLQTQDTFGLHREINRKLRRRKVIAPFTNYQWDLDTANFKSFTKVNNGYTYFLLAIDVFSRYVRTFPLKTIQGKETAAALKSLFGEGTKPMKLRTDKGVEFRNKEVSRLLKEKGVEHFVTQNEQKSSYAESHKDHQI
jgi:transposase InsO family protein